MGELLNACRTGNVVEVRKILNSPSFSKSDLEDTDASSGWTPLHAAVAHGPLELVRLLITSKANVDAKTCSGETPLHLIAKSAPLSMKAVMMIETLVKSGKADVSLADSQGTTPHEILAELMAEGKAGSLAQDLLPILKPATTVQRTESVRKLLEVHIPDPSKPVPYRELSPRTPPLSPKRFFDEAASPPLPTDSGNSTLTMVQENARLSAENQALREELGKLRAQLQIIDPKQQLKRLYSRLIQLESIESALKSMT